MRFQVGSLSVESGFQFRRLSACAARHWIEFRPRLEIEVSLVFVDGQE
jgi:hypothetical protein